MDSKKIIPVAAVVLALSVLDFLVSQAITLFIMVDAFGGGSVLMQAAALSFGGLLLGFLNAFVLRKTTQDDGVNLAGAVFAPLPAFILMFAFLRIFSVTSAKVDTEHLATEAHRLVGPELINQEQFTLLFLLSFNLPFLYFFFKKEERDYRALLWYVLALVLYFFVVPWIVGGYFSAVVM